MTTAILELDEVLGRYAWGILRKRSNFIRRFFLDEKDYYVDIDWTFLNLEHKLARFSPKEQDNVPIQTNWGSNVTGSKWVSLWSCDFDNKADMKQTHAFRGSRDTTTWVDVDVEQCYTIKKDISVEVNIPPNLSKFRAGRDNSLSLNKMKGQVFKEVLTWEVNSQVEVLPSWRAHAELLAREELSSMEFEIRTTLFNPRGVVPISFKKKSDNKTAFVVELENFQEAFKLEDEGGVLTPEEKSCVEVMMERTVSVNGEEDDANSSNSSTVSYPQLITKGSCVCLSWGDQKVDIKTSPMSVDESTYDGDGNTSALHNIVTEKKLVVKAT